ncbi:MAG TPA: DUF4363 family protein [Firmicutes bacterium]|nr:DUF4363 family protein [Bacillota bacterium]
MRIIIIVLFLLALLIGSGIYTESALKKQAAKLQSALTGLEESILAENRAETQDRLNIIETLWMSWRRLWVLLIDHHELEEFELVLARVKALFLRGEAPEITPFLLAEISAMKQLATQIADQQSLTLENIF